MLTSIAVILRITSNSVANLYQKIASEKESSIIINLYAYFIMSVLCVIPAFFVDWTQFTFEFWLNVLLGC